MLPSQGSAKLTFQGRAGSLTDNGCQVLTLMKFGRLGFLVVIANVAGNFDQ